MEFNSQICTTKEQSERLLALGLKKETADMVMLKELTYDEKRHCLCDADTYMIRPIDYLNGEEHRGNIPAWSLHRLMGIGNFVNVGFLNIDKMYECCIQMIEGQIRGGILNKKYLNEK